MNVLRIRAWLLQSQRRLLVALVVLGLAGAIVAHHAMPESMPMEGMHSDHALTMCLGLIAAGTAVTIVGVAVRRRRRAAGRLRPPVALRLSDALATSVPMVRARAGPTVPLHLRLEVIQR